MTLRTTRPFPELTGMCAHRPHRPAAGPTSLNRRRPQRHHTPAGSRPLPQGCPGSRTPVYGPGVRWDCELVDMAGKEGGREGRLLMSGWPDGALDVCFQTQMGPQG